MKVFPSFFIITFLLFRIGQIHSQSTVESDQILFQKRLYPLLNTPLDQYFLQHPLVTPNAPAPYPLKERLYRAQWRIENNELVLVQLQGARDSTPLILERQLPLIADWYSGLLVAAVGKELYFDLSGDAISFSRYQLWLIKDGKAMQEVTMSYVQYEQYKNRQFQQFKTTPEYQDMLQSLQELGLSGNLEDYIFSQNLGYLDIPVPFS